MVLLASCLLTAVVGSRWYEILLRRPLRPLRGALAMRLLLFALPIALLVALYVTLTRGAAREVREHLFVQSWPAVPLVVLSILLQLMLRPSQAQPKPNVVTRGLLPALGYLALAIVALFWLGPDQIGAKQ